MTYSPDDYYNDPIMDAVFESFFDMKTEDNSWKHSTRHLDSQPEKRTPKIQRKRKSLDWDSKPLEKRRDSSPKSVKKPVKSASTSSLGITNKEKDSAYQHSEQNDLHVDGPFDVDPFPFYSEFARHQENSIGDNLEVISGLLLDTRGETSVQGTLFTGFDESQSIWLNKEASEDELAKKRSKWSDDELHKLWEGISKHGNNWTDIMGEVTTRSYCQIKDKGRRCLFLLGWRTGRSKVETDSSSLHAKRIANQILANWDLRRHM